MRRRIKTALAAAGAAFLPAAPLRIGAMRKLRIALAAAAAAVFAAIATVPAGAVSAPFTWGSPTSAKWCPNLRGTFGSPSGCNANGQTFTSNTAPFYTSQVSINGSGYTLLTLNSAGTESGAMTTGGEETFSAPQTISEQLYLPCSGSPAQVNNWPGFWMVTTGSWPAGGEFDIAEGLHGVPAWHYHYLNSSGVNSQVGGNMTGVGPNFPCGVNGGGAAYTYKMVWTSTKATFYAAGVEVGAVAKDSTGCGSDSKCQTTGVNLATGPMYLINDYASGAPGGPVVDNTSMRVRTFSQTSP